MQGFYYLYYYIFGLSLVPGSFEAFRKEGMMFLCFLLVCLELSNFSRQNFVSLSTFLSSPVCLYFYTLIKLLQVWQLPNSLLQTLSVTVCQVMSFLGKTHYLLGTGKRYGPTAQHMQDSLIFFIQLSYCA